ncbi:MAG: O-methyltransferase [Eubacteriales bacterium]
MNITNDKVTDYINSYYKPLSNKLSDLRKRSQTARIPIILKETESCMSSILLLKNPKKILEIGTANGYSASFFATLLPDCKIVTIESLSERYKEANLNFKEMGISNRIVSYHGLAEEVILQMEKDGECGFDFVFIDAAKSKYLEFFKHSIKLCNPNAIIISDNVLMRAMVASDEFDENNRYKTNIRRLREYVNYLFEQKNQHTSILSVGDGLAVTQLFYNNQIT